MQCFSSASGHLLGLVLLHLQTLLAFPRARQHLRLVSVLPVLLGHGGPSKASLQKPQALESRGEGCNKEEVRLAQEGRLRSGGRG